MNTIPCRQSSNLTSAAMCTMLLLTLVMIAPPAMRGISQGLDINFANQQAISLEMQSINASVGSIELKWITTQNLGQLSNVSWPSTNGHPGCDVISQITGKPCNWSGNSGLDNERHVVEIKLESGGNQLSEGQAQLVRLADYEELASAETNGQQYGWLTHIRVAEGLRGTQLGNLTRTALDRAILKYSIEAGLGATPIHIFVDAAGWGTAEMAKIASTIWANGTNIWLYIIRP